MTALEEEILKLPRLQKISLMEQLWVNLSQKGEQFELPEWHAAQLQETEQQLKDGKEHFENWAEAKQKLRNA
jgi:hypothetical protein